MPPFEPASSGPVFTRRQRNMDLSPYKNPKNKNGGPLKTTTWGALIAFSLLLAGLGLTGHLSQPVGGPQAIQTTANKAAGRASAPPAAARGAYSAVSNGGAFSGASTLQPHFEIRENSAIAHRWPTLVDSNPAPSQTPSVGLKDPA